MVKPKKYTEAAKPISKATNQWHLVDAENNILGKLAATVADVLRGKNKPIFSPHVDCGDQVIIINAEKITLTGNKMQDKMYRSHSGHLGHLKEVRAKFVQEKKPQRIIEEAVKGMLPKNKLRRHFMKKLYIYAGPEHKQAGQNPIPLKIK